MRLSTEDKIVLFRFAVGVFFGLVVLFLSLFLKPDVLTLIAFGTSVLVYFLTVLYVNMKYKPLSRFQIYLRGLATFYSAWLLTAILLHEVLKMAGLK